MKKTLITLAALAASVASAAVVTNSYTFNGSVLNLGTALDYSNDWTLTFSVTTGSSAYNDWGTGLLASGNSFTENDYTGGFQIWTSKDGTNTLSKLNGSSESKVAGWGTDATQSITLTYTSSDRKLALTGGGFDISSTIATDADSITQLSSGAYGLDGWTLGTITTEVTVAGPVDPEVPGGDTPAIPEPTTATLSLLALAGLAARRRRK